MSSKISKLVVAIILIFSLIIGIYFYNNNNKTVIMNDKHSINNKSISIMLETDVGTGVYEVSEDDEWPGEGYELNTTRSGCENGSTISYDTNTDKVVIRGNISDKCYIYFDVLPHSINLAIPDCPNAVVSWDRGLQQLAVTSFTTSTLNCTLEEETVNNVSKFSDYIIGLSGTTQGDGKLIHETFIHGDYVNRNVVTTYGTNPAYFRNTGLGIEQTEVDSYWTFDNTTGTFTSDQSKMTTSGSSAYYHVYVKVPEAGSYQICYTINKSTSSNNSLYIVKNTTLLTRKESSTSTQVGEACYDMGYFEVTDYINIVELGYSGTSSPVMSFRIKKGISNTIDTGYRYEGENPNNYIMFNNELWRIIGVFSTEYDINNDRIVDTTNNLVKIIREESIGAFSMNNINTNDWPNSSLYNLLNKQYYDWDTYKSSVNTYCYADYYLQIKCDYSVKGIQDEYRNMIVKAKWYLGGGGSENFTSDNEYIYERDANAVYSGRSASTLGNIGLMYLSDYLYGVLASNCGRIKTKTGYNTADCSGKDWLYGEGYEWTISQYSDDQYHFWVLNFFNSVSYGSASDGYSIRPTLYLSDSVYRISGTGTITDPYIIGM